jgi:hypothetical protein
MSTTECSFNCEYKEDPQEVFDRLYDMLTEQLNTFYPEHTVTITSSDLLYITPSVKSMLRRKNKLMRSGRVEQATALAAKIGESIKKFNSAELSRADVIADPKKMWAKVRRLTGRSKNSSRANPELNITASTLNEHYANISTDASYKAPGIKLTANVENASSHVTEWQIFRILDGLKPTATGLDNIPAWFLKIGAPFFAAPLAEVINLSLSMYVVPKQWKAAYILPVPKTGKSPSRQSFHGSLSELWSGTSYIHHCSFLP